MSPRYRVQTAGGRGRDAFGRRHFQHRAGQRVFAAGLQRGGGGQQRAAVGGRCAVHRLGRHQARPAFGQRAGLVEGHHAQRVGHFQGLRVGDQNAALRRHAGAGHQRGRRGQAQSAGAGNHQHGHGVEHRRAPVAGPETPAQQRDERDDQHHRHEDRADLVHQALNGRLLALRRLDQPHDARQHRFGPHRRGAHVQQAFGVDGAAGDALADFARHRQAFAGDQRFVDVAGTEDDDAIDGQAFTGAHDDDIADAHPGQRHGHFRVAAQHARRFGPQGIQGADGRGGLPPRAGFQPLAQQHQRDDHRRAFEIQRGHAAGRGVQQFENAQAVSRAGADGDQQVHVAAARPRGAETSAVEARAQHELHRRGQQPLQPAVQHPVLAHQQAQHRQGQRRRQRSRQRQAGAFAEARGWWRWGVQRVNAVAGGLHRRHQHGRREAGGGAEAQGFVRQVDAGLGHAGHLQRGLLDPRDTRGAGHVLDGEAPVHAGGGVGGGLGPDGSGGRGGGGGLGCHGLDMGRYGAMSTGRRSQFPAAP